jgi:uncharacterized alpha-E superfamily protein
MLSRDADACFWMGRYIERAEATARIIDVHYHFGLESAPFGETVAWSSVLTISGETEAYRERYGEEEEQPILHFFCCDEENANSIRSCVHAARENGRAIREQISSEMWESLNTTYLELRAWDVERILATSPHAFFNTVKNGAHLFQGITSRTLMMGECRNFLDVGRFLERANQTSRFLDVRYHDLCPPTLSANGRLPGAPLAPLALDPPVAEAALQDILPIAPVEGQFQSMGGTTAPPPPAMDASGGWGRAVDVHGWLAVLKSIGAYEAYRKTYHQGVTPGGVAEFLILNPQFPASVYHSIVRVETCLRRISGNLDAAPANAAERAVGKLRSQLNYLTAEEILAAGLHEFLDDVQIRCNEIGNAIAHTYLQY